LYVYVTQTLAGIRPRK